MISGIAGASSAWIESMWCSELVYIAQQVLGGDKRVRKKWTNSEFAVRTSEFSLSFAETTKLAAFSTKVRPIDVL